MYTIGTLFILLLSLLTHGCMNQVVGERIERGGMLREEIVGAPIERIRAYQLDAIDPTTVRLHEVVERKELLSRCFARVVVRMEARPRRYPYAEAWYKLLLSSAIIPPLLPSFWIVGSITGPDCARRPYECDWHEVSSVADACILETAARTAEVRRRSSTSDGIVMLFVNGHEMGGIQLLDGIATADLERYPEFADVQTDLRLTFKYGDAYAYTTLKRSAAASLTSSATTSNLQNAPLR